MTSIFSCSWMCRLCGREACQECFDQVRELTTDRVGADEAEIAALQARREKHAHVNPFFLSCTRRNEHRARDFSPMSRFSKDELSQAISEMDQLLATVDEDALPQDTGEFDHHFHPQQPHPAGDENSNKSNGIGVNGHTIHAPSGNGVGSSPSRVNGGGDTHDTSAGAHTNNSNNVVPRDPSSFSSPSGSTSLAQVAPGGGAASSASSSASSLSLSSSASSSPTPSHPTRYFSDAELTEDVFRRVWVKGEPLVVTGLLHKFQLSWTPEYFRSKYGTQSCLILECQTDRNNRVTVGEFFSWFGNYEGRHDCWKLKVSS